MSLILFLLQSPSHLITGAFVGIVTLLVYRIARFYAERKNYPPGPFPLPFLGNFLLFRGQKKHVHEVFLDLADKYGPVFTFYFGSDPQVFVTSKELAIEVMKKHQFAGRPRFPFVDEFFKEDSIDVVFADFNTEWEVLRKVSHSALRKYAVSEKLPLEVCSVVDEVVGEMKKQVSEGKELDMKFWLYRTLYTTLARSAFGTKYHINDLDMLKWIDNMEMQNELTTEMMLVTFVPILKIFYFKTYAKMREMVQFQWDFAEKKYNESLSTFDGVTIRDFSDAMLMAKKEAEEEDALEVQKYLKPWNVMNAIQDLFTAGSETSRTTLLWFFLFAAAYPDYQKRIRKEIEENIADDETPTLNHRLKCNLTCAFISEILRYRHVFPSNLPHKATVDVELGGYMIKEGTSITPFIHPGLMDKEIWGDPDIFRPERFLDVDGKYNSKPHPLFAPFSAGRRTCPGEKLAYVNMFYMVARFFQQTKGNMFVLPDGVSRDKVDLYGDWNNTSGRFPVEYTLTLKPVVY